MRKVYVASHVLELKAAVLSPFRQLLRQTNAAHSIHRLIYSGVK